MSRAAKLTLAGTSAMAASIVLFVHYTQRAEKAAMHEGVIRDLEQQRLKRERQADFEMQRQLEAEYRQVQSVTDGRSSVTTPTSSTSTAVGGSAAAEAAMEGGR